jgi:hypothetical protein
MFRDATSFVMQKPMYEGEQATAVLNGSIFIPWDEENNQPLDMGGEAGREWIAAGSPSPDPYAPPPETKPAP